MSQRRTMVQARSKMTRERVLEAATQLVLERGHEALAMKDLVELSGVSNGSIFHHFGSRDGVLEEIFKRERRAYLAYVSQCTLEHQGDPCEALGEGARGALMFQARDPQRYYRLNAQFSNSEWLREKQTMWNDLAADIERPVIEWGMPHFAAKRLPLLAPALIQSLLLGPPELVCNQWRAGRIGGQLADHADTVAAYVTAGMRHLRDMGNGAG
ncbi:TetR/AcrR family transcriptional regulator [Qipengyuania sp. RANM35]|uniref:TetR/AcrR family transcriptional regulator n=1 Tax=Qipengyuania sp. RANM35 TaxID=3068635 RepID=UPI0034DAEFB4